MTTDSITLFGSRYCIIDIDNLFVCSTLEDEILVLGGTTTLWTQLAQDARSFGLALEPKRNLSTYSGGEQAILCCLLLIRLMPQNTRPILLVRVLETLSEHNRTMLAEFFTQHLPSTQIFTLTLDQPHVAFP